MPGQSVSFHFNRYKKLTQPFNSLQRYWYEHNHYTHSWDIVIRKILDCMLLPCFVCISEWIYTLWLPECQWTPCLKQAWYLKSKWQQQDSNPQPGMGLSPKKTNNNVIFYSQLFLGNWNVCQKINKPSIMTIFAQIWPDQHFPKRCVFVSFWQLLTPSIMQKFLRKMLNRQKERQMKEIP